MRIMPLIARAGKFLSQPLVTHAVVLALLTVLSLFIAYQTRPALKVDVGSNDAAYVRGFYYYFPDDDNQPSRWTAGDGRIILRDIGKATPLLLSIRTNAWRWNDRVYTGTVTINGNKVGEVSKAGWREWRFLVSDPTILNADELIVGIRSETFVPKDLASDYEDERELGINVDWVEIQPQWSIPKTPDDWLGLITIPSTRELVLATLVIPAIYLFLRWLQIGATRAFYIAAGALALLCVQIAFVRTQLNTQPAQLIALVGIALAAVAFGKRGSGEPVEHRGARGAFSIAIVIALAFILRFYALAWIPMESDDQLYMESSEHYARAIEKGDWGEIVAFEDHLGHPAFYRLVFAASLVLRDLFQIPLSKVATMRLTAAVLGTLHAGMIALINPLAGWFAAIQTSEIKFSSLTYLEALPGFASAIAVIAFEKFRRTDQRLWLCISAIAVGITGASKFIYLTAAMAIVVFLFWEQRHKPRNTLLYLGLAGASFVLFDPYIWYDPIGRMLGMLSFHLSSPQDPFVLSYNRPVWYGLFSLSRRVFVIFDHLHESPPIFLIELDGVIYFLGLLGLPSLWRRSRLYVAWLAFGAVFLLIWGAKWDQYSLIIATPLLLSAGWGVLDLANWVRGRLQPLPRISDDR